MQINTYTDCKHNITFRVGNSYNNFMGRYRIEQMEIDENNSETEPVMLVQYLDIIDSQKNPLVQTLPIREQGRIIRNTMRRFEHYPVIQNINFSSSDFMETAGYLAQYGRIRVECPKSLHDSFQEIYSYLTGDNATNHYGHGYAVVKDETKGTSFELRINFPMPSQNINLFNLPILSGLNHQEINYVDFVIQLFKMGFQIGQNHNIDKMFDTLSENHQGSFYQGFNVLPLALAA